MQNVSKNKRKFKQTMRQANHDLFVRLVAGIMVFCTVCSLGFPALAENTTDSICNLDHEHDLSCNVVQVPSETDEHVHDLTEMVLHTHNEFCSDLNGNIICPLAELKEHKHSEECYEVIELETEPMAPAHVHSDECYTMMKGALICVVTEQVVHTHTEECYELVVQETLPEVEVHEHTDTCYTLEKGELTCNVPEQEGHTHGESCYVVGEELICATEETETHVHTEVCYGKQLICEQAEEPGHSHLDDCFAWNEVLSCNQQESSAVTEATETTEPTEPEKILICTQKEKTLYIHKDSCYAMGPACDGSEHEHTDNCAAAELVCGRPEACEHVHEDACYEWTRILSCEMPTENEDQTESPKTEKVLVCTKKELINHIHSADCYATDSVGETGTVCGLVQMKVHQHTEECLDLSESKLLCELEENEDHKHNFLCYSSWSFGCQNPEDSDEKPSEEPTDEPTEAPTEAPIEEPTTEPTTEPSGAVDLESQSDPTADLEDREMWEKTFAHVELTGAWSYDLLEIAKTQLGYKESQRNYLGSGEDKRGYTRYGAWYGTRYGHWCAMFVSFCLNYAEVEGFPLHSGCMGWIRKLNEMGMFATADCYMPKPGDLIFFDSGRLVATSVKETPYSNHVGIVTQVIPETKDEPAKILTIEGNNLDSVREDIYDADDPRIVGYGLLPDGPAAIYSCGMEKHVHDKNCFGEENTMICQVQEHMHNEICRSRNLQYADDSMSVDVTLSNAVYLPENLSLHIEMVPENEKRTCQTMVASIGDILLEGSNSLQDVLFYRVELLEDGQPCQKLLGVQADVQLSYTQPVPVSKMSSESVDPEVYMLIEAETVTDSDEKTTENAEMPAELESYRAVKVIADGHEIANNGISSVFFSAGGFSDFVIILGSAS